MKLGELTKNWVSCPKLLGELSKGIGWVGKAFGWVGFWVSWFLGELSSIGQCGVVVLCTITTHFGLQENIRKLFSSVIIVVTYNTHLR